jgi:Ca2+-binding RTX toxin-like protein
MYNFSYPQYNPTSGISPQQYALDFQNAWRQAQMQAIQASVSVVTTPVASTTPFVTPEWAQRQAAQAAAALEQGRQNAQKLYDDIKRQLEQEGSSTGSAPLDPPASPLPTYPSGLVTSLGQRDNRVNGTNNDDRLSAGNGNNQINSLAGNDEITVRHGNNTLLAGEGNNVVTAGHGNNVIRSGSGRDTINVGHGNNQIETGAGNDMVSAGHGNNSIRAGAGDDLISTGNGNNLIEAGAGNDRLVTGHGNDHLSGGEGSDTYVMGGAFGNDVIDNRDASRTTTDVVDFAASSGLGAERLWFRRDGQDLVVDAVALKPGGMSGTSNDGFVFINGQRYLGDPSRTDTTTPQREGTLTLRNWYADAASQVDVFQDASGRTLQKGQVDGLVAAMASFGGAPATMSSLSEAQRQQLDVVIAQNWAA